MHRHCGGEKCCFHPSFIFYIDLLFQSVFHHLPILGKYQQAKLNIFTEAQRADIYF